MENESFDPVEIGVFGPFAEVFETDMVADDVEEFWLIHGTTPGKCCGCLVKEVI